MRHTEFWARMDVALGPDYSRFWASQQVLGDLDGRTPQEALDDGEPRKAVWRAVWAQLGLPFADR